MAELEPRLGIVEEEEIAPMLGTNNGTMQELISPVIVMEHEVGRILSYAIKINGQLNAIFLLLLLGLAILGAHVVHHW